MALFRRRFADLVDRQLDLFASQHAERLREVRDAYARLNASGRDDSEEAFGDYQDQVDWAAEELVELRDGYADTLEGGAREAYARAFQRGVRRRFPPLADVLLLDRDDDAE
jgi:flagellar biosynthesis/type III secretory pathway protein FliH